MAQRDYVVAIFNESAGWALEEALLTPIRDAAAAAADSGVRRVSSRRELLEALDGAYALFGAPLRPSELAPHLDHLELIQLTGSRADSALSFHEILGAGVRVAGASPPRAPQVAEHAIMLLLALFRAHGRTVAAQSEHRWASSEIAPRVREVSGSTIGVVGLGAAAHEICARLKPFGCEILCCGADVANAPQQANEAMPFARLDECLSRSDAVILTPPKLHPAIALDAALISRPQFESMKPSAFLIDVSGPGVVNEDDLVRALRRGEIAAAALDDFEHMPLPPDSPLWTMPGVTVTPHLAGVGPGHWRRAVAHAAQNLTLFTAGQEMIDEIRVKAERAAV